MSEEKRIYVIVAKTVQNPIYFQQVGKSAEYSGKWLWTAGKETKTIVQPPGRIAAQAAHVVSKMCIVEFVNEGNELVGGPVTTIILSVPDIYQLEFRQRLIESLGVVCYNFYDVNEEYGNGTVLTAICTVPVEREKLYGAIDYLPLWDGKTD